MRVIAGKVRGLKLNTPEGINTRPTLDRVKEAVFSMLLPYFNGAVILDLFAGSGALGIEALSRGAAKAYFVDNSQEALNCVQKNVSAAKFESDTIIKKMPADIFLNSCNEKFDIIFLDPPYSQNLYTSILQKISDRELLSKDGVIVVEWDYESGFSNEEQNFEVFKEKKYGRVGISILKWS